MSDFNNSSNSNEDFEGLNDLEDFELDEDEYETIVVTDEEGKENEFIIIDSAEAEGAIYLLVLEAEYIDDEEAEATILKQVSSNENEAVFEHILDDAEFERVAALFQGRSDEYDIEI